MLIKSATFTQASGSIGGMTAGHNKGGLYLRARGMMTNPQTGRQVAVRGAMTSLVNRWNQTLTSQQRAAWNLYASNVLLTGPLGDPLQLSGQNQYARSNVPRIQAGLAIVDDAPTTFDLGDPGDLNTLAIDIGTGDEVSIAVDGTPAWAADDNANALIYLGRPQNAGRTSFQGPWRYYAKTSGNSGSPVTSISLNPASAPFALAAGQAVAAYVRVSQADGRLSGRVQLGPVIVLDT